jgi:hypothetical protein
MAQTSAEANSQTNRVTRGIAPPAPTAPVMQVRDRPPIEPTPFRRLRGPTTWQLLGSLALDCRALQGSGVWALLHQSNRHPPAPTTAVPRAAAGWTAIPCPKARLATESWPAREALLGAGGGSASFPCYQLHRSNGFHSEDRTWQSVELQ